MVERKGALEEKAPIVVWATWHEMCFIRVTTV